VSYILRATIFSMFSLLFIGIFAADVYAMKTESVQSDLFYTEYNNKDEASSRFASQALIETEKSFVQSIYQSAEQCLAISYDEDCHNDTGCCPALTLGSIFSRLFVARNSVLGVLQASFYKIILPTNFRPPRKIIS